MKKHFKKLLTLTLLSTLIVKLPKPIIPALEDTRMISMCSGTGDGFDEDDSPTFEKSKKN